MNEQNFDYLTNQLKYTGFGEGLGPELREKIQGQMPDFTILHKAQFGEDQAEVALYFKKSELNEMYYFNRYFLQVKRELDSEPVIQSFRIGRDNNITLKEAYNLMNGRSVHKELTPRDGEKYHAWLQLNFKETDEFGDFKMKQFHQNYGFDLRQTLIKYPIKELENADSGQSLVRSLERGNRQSVTMLLEGKEQQMFIEASPQFKSLNVYNSHMLRVNLHSQPRLENKPKAENLFESQTEKPVEKQEKKQSAKEPDSGDDDTGEKQSKKETKKQRQSLS
jgi:hypothetical protein